MSAQDLREQIADILADHHNDPDNYNERCLCGDWRYRTPADGSWEEHVADAISALADNCGNYLDGPVFDRGAQANHTPERNP